MMVDVITLSPTTRGISFQGHGTEVVGKPVDEEDGPVEVLAQSPCTDVALVPMITEMVAAFVSQLRSCEHDEAKLRCLGQRLLRPDWDALGVGPEFGCILKAVLSDLGHVREHEAETLSPYSLISSTQHEATVDARARQVAGELWCRALVQARLPGTDAVLSIARLRDTLCTVDAGEEARLQEAATAVAQDEAAVRAHEIRVKHGELVLLLRQAELAARRSTHEVETTAADVPPVPEPPGAPADGIAGAGWREHAEAMGKLQVEWAQLACQHRAQQEKIERNMVQLAREMEGPADLSPAGQEAVLIRLTTSWRRRAASLGEEVEELRGRHAFLQARLRAVETQGRLAGGAGPSGASVEPPAAAQAPLSGIAAMRAHGPMLRRAQQQQQQLQ